MPCSAPYRSRTSRKHRQKMQLITDYLRLGIHNNVDVSRTQPAAAPEETEWKARGQFKTIYHRVSALRKRLFPSWCGRGMMRHIRKVRERALLISLPLSGSRNIAIVLWPTCFDQNRK